MKKATRRVAEEGGAEATRAEQKVFSGRPPPDAFYARKLQEQEKKESDARDKFEESGHLLRKPRNPCCGELTHREDAELLIPLTRTAAQNRTIAIRAKMTLPPRSTSTSSSRPSDDRAGKARAILSNTGEIHSLQRRKSKVDEELEAMKKLAAYKAWCLERMPPGAI